MSCITDAKEICTFTGEMPPGWEATKYEIWTNDGIKEMACAELIDCICEDSQLRCAEPA